MKSTLSLLVIFVLVNACAKSGDSASGTASTPIQGADYSGNYKLAGFECYSADLTSLTSSMSVGASPVQQLTIVGNSFASTDTTVACIAMLTGKVVFDSSANLMTLTGQKTTTQTGNTCSYSYSLTLASGTTLDTNPIDSSFAHNGTRADVVVTAVRNTTSGAIGVASSVRPVGRPTDQCFSIYLKE